MALDNENAVRTGSFIEVITSLQPRAANLAVRQNRRSKHRLHKKAGVFCGVVLSTGSNPLSRTASNDSKYLVMSLSKRSWPFAAGQIVWINSEQITFLNDLS